MKKLITIIGILGFAGIAFALPFFSSQQTMVPFVNNSYDLGTTSQAWRNYYGYNIRLSTTTNGCVDSNNGVLYFTGIACGTSSGGGIGDPFTHPTSIRSATSTTLELTNGILSTASSTFSSNLFLTSIGQGSLYTGSNGLVNKVATSTLSGSGLISVTAGAYILGGTPIVVSCATCGAGTVTSVGLLLPAAFTITNSPVTTSGTLTGAFNFPFNSIITSNADGTNIIATTSQLTVGTILATSTVGKSSFINASSTLFSALTELFVGSTGQTTIFGTATSTFGAGIAGTALNITGTGTSTFSNGVDLYGGTGCFAINHVCLSSSSGNSGTVTSVTQTVPAGFIVSGSPVTTSGTLAILANLSQMGIVTVDSAGTGLVSTTSQLTVGSLIATTTSNSFFTGNVGIATTSPKWKLQIASTTQPQIALSGRNIDDIWTMRSIGNSFYLATASPTTFATSSLSALTINNNGYVGIATTSPNAPLSVIGDEYHRGKYVRFGTADSDNPCNSFGATCVELVANDNTSSGVYYVAENISGGTSAYSGYTLLNNLIGNNTTNYGGIFLNSSTYNDSIFGFANNFPNLLALQNTMGNISLQASSTAVNTYGSIDIFINGVASGNQIAKFNINGLALGTTTPSSLSSFTVASNTPYSYITENDGPVGAKHWQTNVTNGVFSIGTTSDTSMTSTSSALSISAPTAASPGTTLGIATTSPWRTLSVVGTMAINGLTSSTAGNAVCILGTFDVVTAGNTTCVTSSIFTKDLLGEITSEEAERVISQLSPKIYVNKEGGDTRYGFIVEEVVKIDPLLVEYAKEDITLNGHLFMKGDPLSFDYLRYNALLTKYVQDHSQKNNPSKWSYLISLFILAFLFQQYQIYKLKKKI